MQPCIIYHNPKCSKSRQTLELLKSHGITPTIVEYLKTPLNLEQITELRSYFDLNDFVRTDEPVFMQLHLNLQDEPGILKAMLKEPILMQRPIVTFGGMAVIARPPERVLELIK